MLIHPDELFDIPIDNNDYRVNGIIFNSIQPPLSFDEVVEEAFLIGILKQSFSISFWG